MKKLIIILVILFSFVLPFKLNAQFILVNTISPDKIEKTTNNKTYEKTIYLYKIKDKFYIVYKGKRNGIFVLKKSKNTNKIYKYYLTKRFKAYIKKNRKV